MVKWYWLGKTEVLGVKPVSVLPYPPLLSHGPVLNRNRTFATTDRRWCSWLRHCATSRKVACSIFRWHNPSGRTMVLGSTHPLTGMSNRNISFGGKDGRHVGLKILSPPFLTFMWPCIVIYSYKNQRDALISHICFGIELYMFRTGFCPSSGV